MRDGLREELLSDAASVPAGPCKSCEREVLAYPLDPEADGAASHACVHCDTPLRAVYLIGEDELEALGYDVADPLRAGCGTGCAAGGCGPRRG